jgi:hypothetical protein
MPMPSGATLTVIPESSLRVALVIDQEKEFVLDIYLIILFFRLGNEQIEKSYKIAERTN